MRTYAKKAAAAAMSILLLLGGCASAGPPESTPAGSVSRVSGTSSTAGPDTTAAPTASTVVRTDGSHAPAGTSAQSRATASGDAPRISAATSTSISTVSVTASATVPMTTGTRAPRPAGSARMTNLDYDNGGRFIGDNDGPAYVSYSKKGYARASVDVLLSDAKVQIERRSDGKILIAYAFLGLDTVSDDGVGNCLDAGLQYGTDRQWHVFYNLQRASVGEARWYESRRFLDPTHDYRLTLDCSKNNGWAELTVLDLTTGLVADSVWMQALYAKKDGSNVDFYQDYALDFPDDVKFTPDGAPGRDDFVQITRYNMDEGCYLKDLRIVRATLDGQPWTAEKTDRRVMWPDRSCTAIGRPIVRVSRAEFDTQRSLDLDLDGK